ncbi:DUF6403 family protein [Mangrovihabitans endophyticus]|uniref:Uncharacterized protein n=1 Tax=Mangrovihabitans endophyticus TaxID=1751298 RepID=A0A8J3C4X8_9ACTN|nr:DUF6403 family protein [Mangrovihabitans endophyticus]GGL19597.1 hypothetical protein GCM10012284_62720 [Mangrovihabitans endophyticus]
MTWLIWPAGVVALFAAGYTAARLPRLRAEREHRRAAWSAARAAIAVARISRDAAATPQTQADQLLGRAEAATATGGGAATARAAADWAARADGLWRAAADG